MGGGRRLVGYSNAVVSARLFAQKLVFKNAEKRACELRERRKKSKYEKVRFPDAGVGASAEAKGVDKKSPKKKRGEQQRKKNIGSAAAGADPGAGAGLCKSAGADKPASKKNKAKLRLEEARLLALASTERRVSARVKDLQLLQSLRL
jgi:hypothetical protein